MCELVQENGIGLVWQTHDELAAWLRDDDLMKQLRANVLRRRRDFSFERDVPTILAALERCAA
jgi:hypothetical protein